MQDMSSSLVNTHPQAIGEKVLATAVASAKDAWGERLVAAYALGSLAHGGFSIHVSDVDLGLILSDPLEDRDTAGIANLSAVVKAGGAPLADRLSVFWGSIATLSGQVPGGRFPPLDRLDLKRFGRLLVGRDIREQLPSPSIRELVVVGAEFALRVLSSRDVTAKLKDPEALAASDLKTLTKLVLYPVRFFLTARTGEVGMNDLAVEYFAAATTGPAVQLAQRALKWRHAPPDPSEPATLKIIEDGLLPLYRVFLDDYEGRLRDYGRADLAEDFRVWREQLATP
jgi:predicted nucleotidyltransferase